MVDCSTFIWNLKYACFILGINFLFGTFITLFVIARLWAEVFWKKGKKLPEIQNFRYYDKLKIEKKIEIVGPILFLALISLYIGFGAENIQQLAMRVGEELMNNLF